MSLKSTCIFAYLLSFFSLKHFGQATMQGLQGPQVWRLLLLLKGQCILYRRHGDVLEPFKYAGYPMLLNAITVDKDDNNFLSSDRASLLVAASELIWLTSVR